MLAAAGVLLAGALPAGAAVNGTVQTAGDPLTVRRAPTTSATAVGSVANGTTVAIDCQATGTSVTGPLGTTTLWDYVPALGGYVSDGYVRTGSDGRVAPDCGVGSGSAECSSGDCAGEGVFRASDGHFLVYDKVSDGKSPSSPTGSPAGRARCTRGTRTARAPAPTARRGSTPATGSTTRFASRTTPPPPRCRTAAAA